MPIDINLLRVDAGKYSEQAVQEVPIFHSFHQDSNSEV
jgi:hypothetical protein